MTGGKAITAAKACAALILRAYPDLKPSRAAPEASLGMRIREDAFLYLGAHVLFMNEQIPLLIAEGRVEKAMRWLGFMQGVLWLTGVPLARLKDMNRSEEN